MRALEKDPSSRYQRASEMRRDLEPFLPAISSTDHALSQTLVAASLPPSIGSRNPRTTLSAARSFLATNRQRFLLAILATFALASVIAIIAFRHPNTSVAHASLPHVATTLPQTLITPPLVVNLPQVPSVSDASQVPDQTPTVVPAVPLVRPPAIRHVQIRRPPVHPRCGPGVHDNYGNLIPCL